MTPSSQEQGLLLDQMDSAEELSFDYIVEEAPDAEGDSSGF